jgi:hypothetical protein
MTCTRSGVRSYTCRGVFTFTKTLHGARTVVRRRFQLDASRKRNVSGIASVGLFVGLSGEPLGERHMASSGRDSPADEPSSPGGASTRGQDIPHWDLRLGTVSKGSAAASLSLPDLRVVERRNLAYAESWRQQVHEHAAAQAHTAKLAERRKHEAKVLAEIRELRAPAILGITRSNTSESLSDTPVSVKSMHADCLRREEYTRRLQQALKEEVLAADRAETLAFLKREALFRVRSNKEQQAEELRRKRLIEYERGDLGRAAELKRRSKEKAAIEAQKQAEAAQLEQICTQRRAAKEAAEKREEEKALKKQKERKQADEEKRRLQREQQYYMERCKYWTLAKKLKKSWQHAEALILRHEDNFQAHILKYNMQDHILASAPFIIDEGPSRSDKYGADADDELASQTAPQNDPLASTSMSSIARSIFAEAEVGVPEAELARLRTKVETARRRAAAAKKAYETARYESMSEEERLLAAAAE